MVTSVSQKNKLAHINAFYFSFNYTDTLENVYKIPSDKVKHIHGMVDRPIYGHTSSQCQVYAPETNSWCITDDADDVVKELFHNTRKPVNEIIIREKSYFQSLASVNIIYVMGHSLNAIDAPYYKEIINSISNNAKWIVYYHEDKDKKKFGDRLLSWKVPKAQIELRKW